MSAKATIKEQSRQSASPDRPGQEWIEIPVPALVSEQTFALAQEQLQKNKQFASRRTIRPTLLQSLLVCQQRGDGWSSCIWRGNG
jgi:site-specific DNA recombinase